MEDNENDLLAELNGDMPVAANPKEAAELAAAAKETTVDPLAVRAKKKTAVGKAHDAAVSAAAAKGAALRGYAVTVEGEYLVASTEVQGKKNKCPYSVTVNVPALEGALSTIKNKLLDKVLKMKYPGYITFVTHEIVDAKPLTTDTPPPANVAYMGWDDLVNHVRAEKLPIKPADYGDNVKELRRAVVDCVLNPTGFAEREKARLASLREDAELEALNRLSK